MRGEGPVPLPLARSAWARGLNAFVGPGWRQLQAAHTLMSLYHLLEVSRSVSYIRCSGRTHLTDDKTEVTHSGVVPTGFKPRPHSFRYPMPHSSYLDASDPKPNHTPPTQAWPDSTLPCHQSASPRGQP